MNTAAAFYAAVIYFTLQDQGHSMRTGKLERIFYWKEETAGEEHLRTLEKAYNKIFYELPEAGTKEAQTMEGILENALNDIDPMDCLLITSRDQCIHLAEKWNLATAAYPNPAIPGQSLFDADVLIESFEDVDLEYLERIRRRHHGIPWVIAETKRCILREICMEDMQALFDLYAEPGMTDYIEPLYPWEQELEYEKSYIEHMYRLYEYGMWVVIEKDTGKLIGRAGLEHREYPKEERLEETDKDMELEMGYAIGTAYQRKGYATEVCQAIIAYAKKNLEYSRINCLIEKENTASIRFIGLLGFAFVGESKAAGTTMLRYVKEI